MSAIRQSIYAIFSAAIIFSCAPQNSVEISKFSPEGKTERLSTFTIEFSKNLAPIDTLDKWSSEEFVKFEPRIPGKFKWVDEKTLIFSPEYALEPIQKYTANATRKVLFDKDFVADFESYEFNTPEFDALKAEFFWTQVPNRSYQVSVKANLHFNYPVVPERLRNFLEVKLQDKVITDYEIVSESSSEIIAINFGEIEQTNKKQELEITVRRGLESVIGKRGLEDERTFEHTLPPITALAITGVSSGFDGTTGWVEVSATQKVDLKKLSQYVKVVPETELKFSISDNRFRLEGNFQNVQTIELKIAKGLPGMYGGELEFEFEQLVSLVNLNPAVTFADSKGRYLMMGGEENLQVNLVNVPEAEVEVAQVFKNNILHFLDRNSYYYYYDEEDNYYGSRYYYYENYGKLLYTEKFKVGEYSNWLNTKQINLNKALGQKYKGIFIVSVRSAKDRWVRDSKILAISDLGIITKKSSDEIMVFVNSIASAKPVNGAEVSVISSNNQTLLTGTTDQQGVIHFKDIKKDIEGFYPEVIIAEKGEDFNYIDLRQTQVETSRFDVGGRIEYSDEFNVFVYGDRNLYRPGETVNISAIVRDDKIQSVKDIPVILKVITPTGKIFEEFTTTLNEQGSFELSFDIPAYAQTGQYITEIYSGSKMLIGTYYFSIEEFVPDKIRVKLTADKEKAYPGESIAVDIDAEFLFGAKAAGLKYEADVTFKHRSYYSKNYPKFSFSNSSFLNQEIPNTQFDGTLDEEGKAVVNYQIPGGLVSKGVISGAAYVSVFDLTGRTVNRVASFDVYPRKYFIGIQSKGYYHSTGENLDFKLITVDDADKIINKFMATATLVRYEWRTVLKKDRSNRYYYTSEKQEVVEWTKDVNLSGGEKEFSFSVDKSGQYELRISKQGEELYTYQTFYAYSWRRSTASSFQVDKEGRIDIVFDKEKYKPGDNAKILFTSPFSGKMLITFERKGVYDYQYIDVNEKSAEITIPVKDLYLPNVYVSATLFKPHSPENTTPFLVGHGFASMKVEKSKNKLNVEISAPELIKPLTTQNITIKTDGQKDIYVTLAAVDEGILQIKNYKTPDPYGYMYAKRALRTSSHDLYELLLPEIVASSSSTGGGGLAMQLKKRTNPITTKRFKLLSKWSGIKKTNEKGEVTISLNIPQFNGEVRLMAVAYTNSKFGSAEKSMKVANDLIVEPEIPRFLTMNDSLVSTVTLINTTDSEDDVTINISLTGPLKVISAKSQTVSLEANSTAQVNFELKAANDIGSGKIVFTTTGLDEVREEIEIGVRPNSPLVSETGSGTIKAGEKKNIDVPKNYIPSTQNTQVTISKFPAVQFADHLKHLVGYPHGCVEQTTSRVFPQLYFEEIAKLATPELYRTTTPVYFVKEGIKKLESMQLFDGSLAYWQGGTYSSWWGSVYAAHFLVEAQKAGFNVSQNVLNNLLKYISRKVTEKSTFDYYTYSNNRRTVTKVARKEILYSLYVLALAGEGDISTMNYYKSRPHLLSMDSKYLLAGSYALMGKMISYQEALPENFLPEIAERTTGGSFDSDVRANAIMLNVLLEVDPENEQVPMIIKYISEKARYMYSTQERSFAFLALGKAARRTADADIKLQIKADGNLVGTFDNRDITFADSELNSSKIELIAEGKGEVYYFWNTEGIKLNEKVKEEDSYLKIRRQYFDYRTNRLISDNNFKQGQLLVCKLTMEGFDRAAENIIISDLIPAGFEIENPRLAPSTDLNWARKDPMNIQYMDIRDDRLLLFTELTRKKVKEFQYLIRVVNKGKFNLPVIGAEAMYDREYHSFHGAGTVTVVK